MARYIERDPAAVLTPSGVTAGTFTNPTITVTSEGIITSAVDGISLAAQVFDDLTDVNLSGLATSQFIQFNGAEWIPHTLVLDDNSDVIITGPVIDEILQFNGSQWINVSLTDAGALILTDIGVSVQAWDGDLDAISSLSGTGYVVRTGTSTYTNRSIVAGDGITITNGNGVASNTEVEINIPGLPTTSVIDGNNDFIAFYSVAGGIHEKITPEDLILDSAPVIDASNLGVGAGIFRNISAKTLLFKSLLGGGPGVTLTTPTLEEIQINIAAGLNDIAVLTPTLDNFIVGNGTNWIQEGPSAARTSLGLGTMAVESASDYLLLAGGTMSGDIDLNNNFIINVPTPINGQDAVNKNYVDTVTPNVIGGDGITENIVGSTITLDVGAGTGILVDSNDVSLDVGFTDSRYYVQSELNSTTNGDEGAALIGTDSKTNLGNATTVEAALEFLNANLISPRIRQDISVWNLDVTLPSATRAIVNSIEVARFADGVDAAIYKDIMLPNDFDDTSDFTLYVSLSKQTAAAGVIRMSLAWQRQGLGFASNVTQSFDLGAVTDIGTLSWTIPASVFQSLDMMTLRLTRLGDSDIGDTFTSGANFFGAFITQ